MDQFTHLRVASGYSLQYGASHPSSLVTRAAELGMKRLALTDRNGLYGAVRFAKACLTAGISPIIGADFAVGEQLPKPRAAARGGEIRDPRLPRVVVLAQSGAGWASLCRLTTAVHAASQRGEPVARPELLAQYATGLVFCLGADSLLGELVAAGRDQLALAELARWRDLVPDDQLIIAATNHQTRGTGVGSAKQAGKLVALADQHGLAAVLTNMVRMERPEQAATTDVLDAALRLVPLDLANIDRRNAEGYLKSASQMWPVAGEVAELAGRNSGAERLIADTEALALRCVLDPSLDLGLGQIHLPEFDMLGTTADQAGSVLRARCEAGMSQRFGQPLVLVQQRLDDELDVIGQLGFESYFLTVADIVELIRELNVRCAARGSGAGSLVNYLLGISGVDPIANDLVMERFLSPLRRALPDIDLDVESARRSEIYEAVLSRFGTSRVACVAMLETYRVRHAVRDVGAALSLPPVEVDAIAKAFPHIRARDARKALRDLPELRAAGLAEKRLDTLFSLVESLDGLPRHIALHPCGVLLSDAGLGDRTPIESSFAGFPVSQFDKDDVEDLGLLKLDILGIRMQSAMAHALTEIGRTAPEQQVPDIDALAPFDDPEVYAMISRSETLGCFQIESPGQRELVGKFGLRDFADIIIDISLFRPGPVKSDMVVPFLEARQGWRDPMYPHPDLIPVLAETSGVVVFHEQIIKMVSVMTGCSLAEGDEARRGLGDLAGQAEVREWFVPKALERGYEPELVERVWYILESFASFGFCKAHAAAFALPTYQSAWLKWHYPAHFLSGILTHDPGMYPKRLLLEEVRRVGVEVLGLGVNVSDGEYRAERSGDGWGIRLSLADVAGISENEISRIVAGRPYVSLSDFWARAKVSEPVAEKLILAGGFDEIYQISGVARLGQVTRRDLLLALADLARADRVASRSASRAKGLKPSGGVRDQAVQLALDFTEVEEAPTADVVVSGLPEFSAQERMQAELAVLGLDASSHLISKYFDFMEALGVTRSHELLKQRNQREVLVAGVKVATQTPPVRSGRRVIFLTLDDASGPADATFFEDVQGPYAATVFGSWLLVVKGLIRRTGPRGISIRATGAWDLEKLFAIWQEALEFGASETEAIALVHAEIARVPGGYSLVGHYVGSDEADKQAPAQQAPTEEPPIADAQRHTRGGGMGRRRVLVHASGYKQSPYADVKPAGESAANAPRKLWHSSPGSSGR